MSTEQAPDERATAFLPTMRKVLGLFRPRALPMLIAFSLLAASMLCTIVGPLLLGQATNLVYEGWASGRMTAGMSKDDVVADLRAAGDDTMADMVAAMQIVPGAGIDFAALGRTLLLVLTVYLLSSGLSWAAGWIINTVVQRVMFRLREDVEHKIHRLPLAQFDRMRRGDVLSRLTNDLDNLNQVLSESLGQIVTSLLTVAGVLVIMFTLSWELTLVTLITVPLTVIVIGLIGARSQRQFAAQWSATGVLNSRVEESITGHQLIAVYARGDEVRRTFDEENEALYRSSFNAQVLAGSIMPAMQFIGNLVYVGIALVGALQVATGTLRLGTVQAFIQYSRQFSQPLAQLGGMASQLQSAAACAERIFELLDLPEESSADSPAELPAGSPAELPAGADPSSRTAAGEHLHARLPQPPRGDIEFRGVRFGYSPDAPLIHNLSLRAAPGSTTAIVGRTGAGKTTLVNLLLRFYELDGGSILFDGVDISQLSRSELRSHIGMVLQDTWLFGGTIEENIAYGRPGASRQDVIAAARACHVDHVVRTLPEGYDTVLDDDGGNLSQGERQLITIARAFLTQPTILVLDEATSSVDTRTELLIQQAMSTLRSGRTSFVIAHRLSTIRDADTILVMDDGDIVEQGSHEELLRRGGAYAALHAAQLAAGGALED